MKKVRILSGNQAGSVVDMRDDEADANVASGFGELVQADDTRQLSPAEKQAATAQAAAEKTAAKSLKEAGARSARKTSAGAAKKTAAKKKGKR
jgi:hypothetical protein